MTQRVNSAEQSADLFQKFTEFLAASRESSIEDPIRDLVAVRAQLYGCTCTSMAYPTIARKVHNKGDRL
ncbi:hypothetical protein [Phyllobacterium zundukense]|nr:hypothetical protein [Phyllobacterium zundukense]